MSDEHTLASIDSLLFQIALQSRELSIKKKDINQEIKVCTDDIAERRSYIETLKGNIKKLEDEIGVKQSTLMHSKANLKSMKATNSQLLQYEQTLKTELETNKDNYNYDWKIYNDRIADYRQEFQTHKEYYCQNPLAQKLLRLQDEIEEIKCSIKACNDKIIMKQTELDYLTGPAVCPSSEKLLDSFAGQQLINESEKQLDPDSDFIRNPALDISSLHLKDTENGQIPAEANAGDEEHKAHYAIVCGPVPGESSNQSWPDGMHVHEQRKETKPQDQVMEQQYSLSEVEQAVEDKLEKDIKEDQPPGDESNEGLIGFSQSSEESLSHQSSPAKMKVLPSTPTFPFNFSPSSSSSQQTSDTKSPAFVFSLNSNPGNPGFSGFGFDEGTSADEDTSFAFTSPFFSQKNTTETKSSDCPGFPFDQSEGSDDFQFTFPKRPQATNKDKTGNEFPFSFNF